MDLKAGEFLSLLVIVVSISTLVSTNSEGDALNMFKRSLSDPYGVLQSWDPTLVNPCAWFHITCNSRNYVIRVDLGNASLSGSLVPDLGHLSYLQYLDLNDNNISGAIPPALGNLTNLVSFNLDNNRLTGPIPDAFGTLISLQYLRINNNYLTGQIPLVLTTIGTLKFADFSGNNFVGAIPTSGSFENFTLKSFVNVQGQISYGSRCS